MVSPTGRMGVGMAAGSYKWLANEFMVNTKVSGVQTDSSIAALPSGGFVITWTDLASDGSGSGVRAQIFDANGVPVGGEFQVNSSTLNNQDQSSVTALAGGPRHNAGH